MGPCMCVAVGTTVVSIVGMSTSPFHFVCSCFACLSPFSQQLPHQSHHALNDTATLEHHSPPTIASRQQYQRYNLHHLDSPISSFVCIYPMRATHFVFV